MTTFNRGDRLYYDMGFGVKIRVTYVENDEGWGSVTCDSRGPGAIPVSVPHSKLTPRENGESA